MERFIPIAGLVALAGLGFLLKCIELNHLSRQIDFTINYRNKFIDLLNGCLEHGYINNDLYTELTEQVVEMQKELGDDGVYSYMVDPLKGISSRNHQALINFLPEVRMIGQWRDNSIMMMRFSNSAQTCDDMFMRHMGQLKNRMEQERKHLFNPFLCLADGIRWILWLPANILFWCGFISERVNYKLRVNWILKLLAFLVTIIGLVGSVFTIVIGWEQFSQIITAWFAR